MTPDIADQIIAVLHDRIDQLVAQVGTLQYEVDAIPGIKEERDALAALHKECVRCLGEALQDRANLAAAAKLALDALEGALDFDPDSRDVWSISGGTFESYKCKEAIAALKKAGVQ